MVKIADLIVKIRTEGAKKAKGAFNELNERVSKFGTLSRVALAAAAFAVTKFVGELTKLNYQMKAAELSFEALTKRSALLRNELRESTRGMTSDLENLEAANKALLLGIDQSKLVDLFRVASVLSKASGRTIAEAIEDISTGIGRQSRLILDNLGIVVKAEEAQKKFAASLGKTASELTESERKLAFLNAAIDQATEKADALGKAVEELQDPTQRAASAWGNFKTELAESAAHIGGPLLEGFAKLLGKYNNMTENVNKLKESTKALGVTLTEQNYLQTINADTMKILKKLAEENLSIQDAWNDALQRGNKTVEENVSVMKGKTEAFKDLKRDFKDQLELLKATNDEEARKIKVDQESEASMRALHELESENKITKQERLMLEQLLNQVASERIRLIDQETSSLKALNDERKRGAEAAGSIDFGAAARGRALDRYNRDVRIRADQRAQEKANIDAKYEESRKRRVLE